MSSCDTVHNLQGVHRRSGPTPPPLDPASMAAITTFKAQAALVGRDTRDCIIASVDVD